MSRSLLAFLLFCLALVLASGALIWHVGPTLAGLVVDQERRSSPYHLLRIVAPGADAAPVPDDDAGGGTLRARLLSLAAEDDGRLVWQGGGAELIEGPARLDGAALQLLSFASGAGVVQFFTSSGYRALEAGRGDATGRYLGTPVGPQTLATGRPSVIVLYRQKPGSVDAPLGAPGDAGWLALAPRHGGELRWAAPLALLRGQGPWDRLLMLQFPDRGAARAWLNDPATVTERALAGRHVDDVVVLLAYPV
ncbi:MAG: hypothetical protein RIB46_01995 [Pseudomonadales bacterium]